jgi:hypothetical protein
MDLYLNGQSIRLARGDFLRFVTGRGGVVKQLALPKFMPVAVFTG